MILAAMLRSATDRPRSSRRIRSFIPVIGVFLLGGSGLLGEEIAPARPAAPPVTFERHEVVTGPARHQTVLTGFLLGGAVAELAVVGLGENGDRRLRVYAFADGAWAPTLEAPLRPEVSFVDVAHLEGRDRLLTYEPGRLNWFDPESATERPLVAVASRFNPPPGGAIRQVDVTRDLNGDGRDDLVVPDSDGFWVFIQGSDGAFAAPVKLGPPAPFLDRVAYGDARSYREVGWTALTSPWHQDRVHEMDDDRDGRRDLVFWNQDHFEVHHQDARGRFAPAARTFTTDVVFEADGLHSLIFRDRRTAKVLHSLGDLNGDRIADLVTFSLEGQSVLSERSVYAVHFGAPTPDGGTAFPRDPGTVVRSEGIQVGMRLHDFDRDGQLDMMFTTVNLGVFKIMGGLLTRSMSFDLEFYRMEDGVYPDTPNAVRKIKASFGKSRAGHPHDQVGGAFFPSVLIGDVNGDGRADLLVGSRKGLRVFPGVPGPALFAEKSEEVAVPVPGDKNDNRELRISTHGNGPWEAVLDEEYAWLVDLNRDGKDDVLVHHPATTAPHRVTLLIAR